MRVLVLPRYSRLGASSRIRFLQYLPYLQSVGVQAEVSHFLGERYQQLFHSSGKKSRIEAIRGYARRVRALLNSRRFDLVWIEKDALPWVPGFIECALLPAGTPYVLDYDDAVFHYYDQHPSAIARRLLAEKHGEIMRGAALVVAGNPYIAEHALRTGASKVEVIPTVVDVEQYVPTLSNNSAPNQKLTVGWIGQPHNTQYLRLLGSAISNLLASAPVRFVAVGGRAQSELSEVEMRPWHEATEIAEVGRFDIGIMPLPDEPFERGKCGYKLIQYMACAKPVIASPVGVNRDIVEHGVNGFIADGPSQWEDALRTLVRDPGLRLRMGRAGRQKVEARYSLQYAAPRLAELLIRARTDGKAH